jgi:hypothetical protein
MLNPDNLYFLDTPVDVQDECYYDVLEQINEFNFIHENNIVYLIFSEIFNLRGKACFKGYIKSEIENSKVFDYEPDFLIFI